MGYREKPVVVWSASPDLYDIGFDLFDIGFIEVGEYALLEYYPLGPLWDLSSLYPLLEYFFMSVFVF